MKIIRKYTLCPQNYSHLSLANVHQVYSHTLYENNNFIFILQQLFNCLNYHWILFMNHYFIYKWISHYSYLINFYFKFVFILITKNALFGWKEYHIFIYKTVMQNVIQYQTWCKLATHFLFILINWTEIFSN